MPLCQPRGKNDESVPNRSRDGPRTASALLNTPSSVRPPSNRIQLFELEVSRFLELLAPDTGGADEIAFRLQWDVPGTATELGDRWIVELDRHGVARAALIASIPGDAASVAEAVAHHPHRFVGFFMHNPTGLDSDAVLERSLKDYQHLTLTGD